MSDFEIDPKYNYGVSHAFNEVFRGKDARKSLTAMVCVDCTKVSCYFKLRLISFTNCMGVLRGFQIVVINASIFSKFPDIDKHGKGLLSH